MKYEKVEIKEDLATLYKELHKYKDYRYRKRIQALILLLEDETRTRNDIASKLDIARCTLRGWYGKYNAEGLSGLLTFQNKGSKSKVITPEIYTAIETKLHDNENPFQSYTEVMHWLEEEFSIKVPYSTLHSYLRRNFNCKLKVPRKRHYKQDKEAVELFKKTS